uniref:C-type lectin domain-containing protein n=1 Tax=Takifugu rubripes TaxID=31033 RepID=A0A674P5V1_TAKRU
MIDDFDLYANVERPAGHPDRMERCRQCCGHVYKDSNQEVKTPQASFSGNQHRERCVVDDCLSPPQKWVYFSGSLYQVSSTKKTWNQSRSDCFQKGADLLIINSKEEQAFANRFQKYMWIGLTDVTNEGSWKWVDGTAMSTSYWSSKEPNGGKGENCGDIKNFNAEKSWNDESCSLSLLWICEKKLYQ